MYGTEESANYAQMQFNAKWI